MPSMPPPDRYGILSVILIIIVGAVLYFGVLPKVMTNDERKI